MLEFHGIICSMSRRGNCRDNAAMESFFSTPHSTIGYLSPIQFRDRRAKAGPDKEESAGMDAARGAARPLDLSNDGSRCVTAEGNL